uniref:Proliferation-inducing protein 13 n=1 Tax=Sus scrofa TaxID=9823 RepID=A0A8D0XLX8_PIG
MGCASAKHVATVQNEEEAQKGKNYQNGDVFGDEYRIKPVEEVKYMKNGAEEEQKIAARNQENLEKSASSNVRLKTNKEIPGLVHQPRANMHISESQQEFFRMLDEKIEKVRNKTTSCFKGNVASGVRIMILLVSLLQSCACKGMARVLKRPPKNVAIRIFMYKRVSQDPGLLLLLIY